METLFCNSCGMPLINDEHKGTCTDGSLSDEYCCWSYKNGSFTQDYTMDEMIEHCAGFVERFNKDAEQPVTKEQAIENMKLFFPTLNRWKK